MPLVLGRHNDGRPSLAQLLRERGALRQPQPMVYI